MNPAMHALRGHCFKNTHVAVESDARSAADQYTSPVGTGTVRS